MNYYDSIKLDIYEAYDNGEISYNEKEYLLEKVNDAKHDDYYSEGALDVIVDIGVNSTATAIQSLVGSGFNYLISKSEVKKFIEDSWEDSGMQEIYDDKINELRDRLSNEKNPNKITQLEDKIKETESDLKSKKEDFYTKCMERYKRNKIREAKRLAKARAAIAAVGTGAKHAAAYTAKKAKDSFDDFLNSSSISLDDF